MGGVITLNLSQNMLTDRTLDLLISGRDYLPAMKNIILSQNKIIERKHKAKIDKLRSLDLTVSVWDGCLCKWWAAYIWWIIHNQRIDDNKKINDSSLGRTNGSSWIMGSFHHFCPINVFLVFVLPTHTLEPLWRDKTIVWVVISLLPVALLGFEWFPLLD